ncbi:MAG: hypothetical protein A2033_13625 [Bacteroidetes bacterium GWA2_31_9]|nr:MAG: hypothetical protein A2033_13625 [Bacteroidetes bacterium GWA2_31_9]
MKLIITLLSFFIASVAISQKSNLIFYTENGERFQVIVNGVLQNSNPETNVKITDLVAPNYQIKVLFENKALGSVDKQIFFNQGNETTFAVKKNKDGAYVIRFRSEVLLAQAPPTVVGQTSYVYSTVAPVTTTISQTTTTVSDNNANGVSMGVNANGLGINVNMNINDGMMENSSTTSSYSTTTTTTTTTTSPVGNVIIEEQPTVIYVPGYAGTVGCARPVNQNEFSSIKSTISSKSFEDSKLTIAKQVVAAKCLTCAQVKEIMMLFSFEDSKLEFAKFAYKHTYDIENYYMLNDAFTFESSIDELNSYINGGGY